MSRIENNEEYCDLQETLALLGGMSKQLFYKNAKPRLRVFNFDARKRPFYKKSDVLALKSGKQVRKPSFVISGMFNSWTEYAKSFGHVVETVDRESPYVVSASGDVALSMGLPVGKDVVKCVQMNIIDGEPVCLWTTYYRRDLVDDALLDELEGNPRISIRSRIQEKHHLSVARAVDKITARLGTSEEQAILKIVPDEPVFVLERPSYASDDSVMMFQSMVLIASYFALSYPYVVGNKNA